MVMARTQTRPNLLALATRVPLCTLGADVPAELPTPEPVPGDGWEYVRHHDGNFGWVERRPVEVEPIPVPAHRQSAAA